MAKFVCKVCGYVYEGDAAPAECPVCHVGADQFEEVKGEMKLAAEHEYGIYAKTVKNNPDISDEDKKYITWQTAHDDISEQRRCGYNGTRFRICPKLVNRNRGKNREPKWDYDILSIKRL